jgi:hypothetical protein
MRINVWVLALQDKGGIVAYPHEGSAPAVVIPINSKVIAPCERRKNLALITELFWTYMEPLFTVSRAKTREGDTGNPDYRHRARTGCVYKR